MRVALITDGIWPYVLGGMQKHSYYLCKYLAQKKIEVDLFHFNQSTYDISKLEFFSEEEKKFIKSFIVDFPKSFPLPGHYLRNSRNYSKLIFENIKDKLPSYDLIYTKGFSGWYLIDEKNKKNIRCASIGVKFHGYEMFQKPPDFKIKLQHLFLLRKPVQSISQKADLVFSYGGKITDIIKAIGVKEENIVEFPSGVEESTLAKSIKSVNGKIKFLFLGRYERRKGIEELNSAIKLFFNTSKNKNAEFHFIGPIPETKRLLIDGVNYHGEIRDKIKLQNLIKQSDILICPSWSEGMPNVILEAMANGLAVIATDVGATNVLVSEATGWLLKSSDPYEIQSAMDNALACGENEIEKKKQNGLNLISKNFTWEKLIEKFYQRFF
ncbi:glycosyltransferase family 4 protein [Aurantibacillus circumpalustris]|uniref:glycosyltransferase family 4 protein n=1 Tax=Aurantibacillus circumpalustris TaxID=3036359 RepID=UPI00295B4DD9|nr:glycosyltransferase family 4 protein [Aurantibacillus circumpalustris]